MKIKASAEMYLETILILGRRGNEIRSIDVANEMNYTKPSVSVAMKHLRESGHIIVDDSGFITLTPSGKAIAETIYERHNLISGWLMFLGVSEKTALDDACRMEHVISPESFEAFKRYAGLPPKPTGVAPVPRGDA